VVHGKLARNASETAGFVETLHVSTMFVVKLFR
jgi:hypothetical protein